MQRASMAEVIRVTRYPNRKLYAEGHGYASLADICRWTHEGLRYTVIEHGTGKDVTLVHAARALVLQAERGGVALWRIRQLIMAAGHDQ